MKMYLYILQAILVFLLASCCDSRELGQINLQKSDLEMNPYQGNENLTFSDNSGNIITYHGNGRSMSTQHSDGCADCCVDYFLIQSSDNMTFSSDYLNSQIAVNIVNNWDRMTNKTNPTLCFSWSDHPGVGSIQNITYNSFPILNLADSARSWNLYFDTLVLRNTTFHNIIASVVEYDFNYRLHPDSIFYSVSEGIVGIRFSDGNLLVKR